MRSLVKAIREFTHSIVNPYDLDEVLHRLADQASAVLGASGSGVLLEGRDGSLRFAAASSETVTAAEQQQQQLSEGAGFEAFARNRSIAVPDLAAGDQWPAYRAAMLELDLRAVVGSPLNAHGQTIGVLNVYRETAGPWSGDQVEASEILAAMGAAYILHANQLRASHELTEQLQYALDSRVVIERAKGILMERAKVDATTAFAWLRDASMYRNRSLRDIARELVESAGPD